MDNTVVIYIQAYNAEHTLRRALESVLRQTYPDWIVYLLDNGSTDGTSGIAREYTGEDSRIVSKSVASNDVWRFYNFIKEYLQNPLGSYFAWLDADDEYKPDFLENAMSSIKSGNLDLCVCGTDYIDAVSGAVQFTKKPETDFVISGDGFSERFLEYRRFTDTLWGKVYSFSLLKSIDYEQIPKIRFAPDSVVVLELFQACYRAGMRIGFLSQSLHRYYRAPNTLSQHFSMNFVSDISVYYKTLIGYLKCFGEIGRLNTDYLYAIWLGWIQDFFPRIVSMDTTIQEKVRALSDIFCNPITHAMLRRKADPRFRNLASREEFCHSVKDWISPYENDSECGLAVQNIILALKVN